MTVKSQSSDAFFAPRSTPLPDGSSAGAAFACYARLKTAGRPLLLDWSVPGGRAGRGMAKDSDRRCSLQRGDYPARLKTTASVVGAIRRTTCDTMNDSGVCVRSCSALSAPRGSGVPWETGSPLHVRRHAGVRRPMVTELVRKGPGRGRAWPGFSRLFMPIRWSDLPGTN